LSRRVGGHAAAAGVVRQLLLECLDARAKLGEFVSQCSLPLLPCRRLGGALLGVEGACRALVGEAP
jgi:hypothetical protein